MVEDIDPNEILLRFSVYDDDLEKIKAFSTSIAPLILSGPPGVAVIGGRARAQQVMTYWPTLIPKTLIQTTVHVLDSKGDIQETYDIDSVLGNEADFDVEKSKSHMTSNEMYSNMEMANVPLRRVCMARSGDKGDTFNIGVLARSQSIYNYLKSSLSSEVLKTMFKGICKGNVKRYELDNLLALNFLLEESLDGGGTKSLMIDAQGKTMASALLNQSFPIPKAYLNDME